MGVTISVTSRDDLYDTLNQVRGGETILLVPGHYGALTMNGKTGFPNRFDPPLTLTSANPDDPAIFDWMDIHGGQNITLDSVRFDYAYQAGQPDHIRPFEINDSRGIEIRNSVFSGDRVLEGVASDDGFGHGYGLSVRDSRQVTIEANDFHHWGRGAIFSQSHGVIVRANDIHHVRSDGLNFAEVTGVLIEENHLHDFSAAYGSQDHRDMIQFWTNGTDSPSAEILIRHNRLDMGQGSFTQSIFMRNEAVDSQDATDAMYYRNVTIEENSIYNGHLHGITVGETDGLTVGRNSLIAVPDPQNEGQNKTALWVPAITVASASRNVSIKGNLTNQINGENGQTDWQVQDNTMIQNLVPTMPGHYDDLFASSSMDRGSNGHHFIPLAGTLVDRGTTEMNSGFAFGEIGPLFQVGQGESLNTKVFDASLTAQMLHDAGVGDAIYTWHFSDGTTAQGLRAIRPFAQAGSHEVTLSVMHPSGLTYVAQTIVEIRGGKLLSFDSGDEGDFFAHGFGRSHGLDVMDAVQDDGLVLTGHNAVATVDRAALEGLRGSDAMALNFSVQGTGAGDLFRAHMVFQAVVTIGGAIRFQLYDQAGNSAVVTSRGVWVNDDLPHDVSVTLKDGILDLNIDGVQTAIARFPGTLPVSEGWDLIFGNPWGQRGNFDGAIVAFDLAAGPELPPLDPLQLEFLSRQVDLQPSVIPATEGLEWGKGIEFNYGAGEVPDGSAEGDARMPAPDTLGF
ncbi:right-handed parallel beta-helix repeat-containing protein [Roseobacter sp. GAI101]|uniref:right-handed parallel beta-helix repeat-containing protein n=1 Tax=Roseobacter sp. (strain GAI101) TaxID=391589 RepID=UPI00018717E0|nr:right-handed parallel beta-helix repeat-containing protein [Roseobacter sp. GAI101]EEB82541.1 hypothetical protein RGAI101_3834 [Roseobacter sp. GAI101]